IAIERTRAEENLRHDESELRRITDAISRPSSSWHRMEVLSTQISSCSTIPVLALKILRQRTMVPEFFIPMIWGGFGRNARRRLRAANPFKPSYGRAAKTGSTIGF